MPTKPTKPNPHLYLPARMEAAIRQSNQEEVRRCLDEGFDPNTHVGIGVEQHPLSYCVANGSLRCMEILLSAGSDPRRAVRASGISALSKAVTQGHCMAVRMLLQANAEPDVAIVLTGRTPALMAAADGHIRILEELCNHGADLSYRDKQGQSALHLSLMNFKALDWVCQRAPHLLDERCTDKLRTPLMMAIDMRLGKSAMALLEHRQDLDARYPDQKTMLEKAREVGMTDVAERIEVIQSALRARQTIKRIADSAPSLPKGSP